MWECGLKRNKMEEEQDALDVTPYVGVWIETLRGWRYLSSRQVTPYVGVWIETVNSKHNAERNGSHSLCGSVD